MAICKPIIPNWQKINACCKMISQLKAVDSMTFYETLAYVLDEKGITPAELSAKTGINQSYFSKLKSGHMKDVTWDKALTIIAALDMTPNDFNNISYHVISLEDKDGE